MISFKEYIAEAKFNDYEALASKFTKMFKTYELNKVRTMSVPALGKVDVYELVLDTSSARYKMTVRRTPIKGEKYTHFYSVKSFINMNTSEDFITKELHIPEVVNMYVQLESFLKTITKDPSEATIKSALKSLKLHASI